MTARVDLAKTNGLSPPSTLARALLRELLADPEALAELAAALAPFAQPPQVPVGDGWLGSRAAAEYLGISVNALHKATAARVIAFEQDVPGGKLWFTREALDAYRRGDAFHNPSIEALPGHATAAA